MRIIISGKEWSSPTKPYCLRVPTIQSLIVPNNDRTMEPALSNSSCSIFFSSLCTSSCEVRNTMGLDGITPAPKNNLDHVTDDDTGEWGVCYCGDNKKFSLPPSVLMFNWTNKKECAEVKVRCAPLVLSWSLSSSSCQRGQRVTQVSLLECVSVCLLIKIKQSCNGIFVLLLHNGLSHLQCASQANIYTLMSPVDCYIWAVSTSSASNDCFYSSLVSIKSELLDEANSQADS